MIFLLRTSVLNSPTLPQILVISDCLVGVQLALKNLLYSASCGTVGSGCLYLVYL